MARPTTPADPQVGAVTTLPGRVLLPDRLRAKRKPPLRDAHLSRGPHRGQHVGEGRGCIPIEVVAGESGGHRGIGEVPPSREGEAPEEQHPQPTASEPFLRDQAPEVPGSEERPHGVGRARADPDLEEGEYAWDVDGLIPLPTEAEGSQEGVCGRRPSTP